MSEDTLSSRPPSFAHADHEQFLPQPVGESGWP